MENKLMKKNKKLKEFQKNIAKYIIDNEKWYRPIYVNFNENKCVLKEISSKNSNNTNKFRGIIT